MHCARTGSGSALALRAAPSIHREMAETHEAAEEVPDEDDDDLVAVDEGAERHLVASLVLDAEVPCGVELRLGRELRWREGHDGTGWAGCGGLSRGGG